MKDYAKKLNFIIFIMISRYVFFLFFFALCTKKYIFILKIKILKFGIIMIFYVFFKELIKKLIKGAFIC